MTETKLVVSAQLGRDKRKTPDRNMIDGWAVYMANSKKIAYVHKSLLDVKKCLSINPNIDYGELAEWSKAAGC